MFKDKCKVYPALGTHDPTKLLELVCPEHFEQLSNGHK